MQVAAIHTNTSHCRPDPGRIQPVVVTRYDDARRALHRRLTFTDFAEALGAMVRIGMAADKADHHPEWTNVYNRLDIWLTTHDTGGVSDRDYALARVIEGIVGIRAGS